MVYGVGFRRGIPATNPIEDRARRAYMTSTGPFLGEPFAPVPEGKVL